MSLNNAFQVESFRKTRGSIAVVLTDASNYNQWRRAVCNAYFALLKKKGDISRISVESMVNWKYYTEKHTTFSKEFSAFKVASKKAKKPK